MSSRERPLVTFALFAYNQEKFISEAVKGAFAQTYSPLEILLSDDCSSDRTFEIIQEMAAAYTGPHKLILNKNSINVGIGGHVNFVMNKAAGEIVVMAAGDDISNPERTEMLVQTWIKNSKPSGMASAASVIDANGKFISSMCPAVANFMDVIRRGSKSEILSLYLQEPRTTLLGCTAAWRKDTYETFGPLPTKVINEDNVFTFRVSLLGGFSLVNAPLVQYRQHDANVWGVSQLSKPTSFRDYEAIEKQKSRRSNAASHLMMSHLQDLERVMKAGLITNSEALPLKASFERLLSQERLRSEWWNMSGNRRVLNFMYLDDSTWIKFLKLLPWKVYICVRFCIDRIRGTTD